ncbi:MAG: NUDIX hydrolase [Desulfocapsaceae bacterium]|nr:NUDIX hydrolase [Desulfocapsaceae bacterium]
MKKREKDGAQGWEVYPRQVLLETPVVTIHSGPVHCSRSGKQKDFYLFEFPEWVNIIALTPQREILLIRQFRYGTNRLEIEIPGGMVNKGEEPLAAGCRELLEETGYAGENARIIGRVCPNPAIQRNYCHTVMVEEAIKVAEPTFDDMEDIECFSLPEKEVLKLIATGDIDHGLVLNALMFHEGMRRE